ncbi:unnamed protein product [Rotaria sp. Silwood2]|nr:unnamed protein product [Rotaria sp. Silwood2]CAF2750336.1 unnamed protein product [Rotaria sp. Silwood2]CAF2793687.1 unnamed protein product [Rotaria sp. Silwood2]CAF2922018.1 unnamed protein product [Rotaria sp. Silwood2]CAF3967030.1 unnamed protein product [Rotaria sp. Silwood2]
MASTSQIQAEATGADNEIRMILLGRTGTVGNTILGGKFFQAKKAPIGVTTQCGSGARNFENKRLFIVDTPGFLDPNVADAVIQHEVGKSYQLTAFPGPHVFLLVLEPTRMLPQEAVAVEYLSKIFGPSAINHTIIIFTGGDQFEDEETTLDNYLSQLPKDAPLKKLLQQCSQRYLCFNNKGTEQQKSEAVRNLLERIADMMSKNHGKEYTTDIFAALAKEIAKEKAKGTFHPVKPDGSYALLPQTKEIVIDGYLRRTVGRRAN